MNYQSRIDQEGMIYLLATWSHIPNDKNVIREMIQFLEKGKGNLLFLQPLYNYSYKKFGSLAKMGHIVI